MNQDNEPKLIFDAPDIPESDLEAIKEVEDAFKSAEKVAIVGAGAGGCRVADAFWNLGYRRVLVLNTTDQDMAKLACPNRLILGGDGGGAGKDPAKGKLAVERGMETVVDKMREVFGRTVDRIILCVGGGGGTGTGAAIPLIEAAKRFADSIGMADFEKKIGLVVTVPKRGESARVQQNAFALLEELFGLAKDGAFSSLILIDNDTVVKQFPRLPSGSSYWQTVNAHFARLYHAFNLLAGRESEEVFDPMEYRTVLESGFMVFGAGKVKSLDRSSISESMRHALFSNFLSEGIDFSTAKCAAALVVANEEVLNQIPRVDIDHAIARFSDFLQVKTTFLGIYEGNNADLRLYTIVGGLEAPRERLEDLRKRGEAAEENEEPK